MNLKYPAKLLVLASLFAAASVTAQTQKVRVDDPAVAARLLAQGGKLVADYGSFQIIQADAASAAGESNRVASAEESNFIELHAAHLDTRTTATKSLRQARGSFRGQRLHLVQFAAPVKPEWRAELEQTGVKIISYIPQNAYLVYGDAAALAQAQAWAGTNAVVQWEGAYNDDWKINPAARTTNALGQARSPGTSTFAIQLVDDPAANSNTLAQVDALKLAPVERESRVLGYLNIFVQLPPERLAELATNADVVSIQPYFPPKKFCERQAQIMAGNLSGNVPSAPGYLAWLAGKGFTQAQFDASGFVVDVTDSGIDNGTISPNHFGLHLGGTNSLASRVVYNRLEGTPNPGSTLQGCDGHGNLNAHIIGGFDNLSGTPFADASGYHYGLGICPFVKVGSSVIFDVTNFTSPNYDDLTSRSYRDGARVSNNSWGADTAGAYDADAQNYDALVRDAQPGGSAVATAGNQEMVIVFAAGNAGSSASTVGSPGTGKNIICVGAAENVQPFGGSDGSGIADTGADSANDIISFSSRGPCTDGRFKPDLCAPGTHVSGGVAQAANPAATGTAIACFDGTGVSGGTGGSSYFPSSGQQFYTASSGTSHSTPGIAGACALLRQYFINQSAPPPSPAMTKAYLVNSTRYMTGTGAGDKLPSNSQGLGSVNLGTAFDGVPRILRDQAGADKFTASGQIRTNNGIVADTSKPFRVTLAWTDAPGNTTGNAYNNNLDLTVTAGGNTYKGNVFSGSASITGGTNDAKNNLECVFIPAGVTGVFIVTVTAANINSDGVPNEAPSLDQDYALVIYNATAVAGPAIQGAGYSLTNENCAATNGVVDPGETVTVNFSLQNLGTQNTSNLVATLLATNGVSSPSGAQSYGALNTNGSVVTMPFTFTASGVCGGTVLATFALADGATNLGTVSFTLPLGVQATLSSENFDSVTAPALPVGWSTTAGGGQSAWVTTTTQRDTLPNSAYSTDASSIGSNALVSAAITLPSGASQLIFKHRFELESAGGTTGYDGGVLEIKIGAGAFTDIIAAGGSFVGGGYNTTLSTGYSNPLGGRSAWSGTNATFTSVVVNLPAAAAGQSVQFRWRCATDSSVSQAGWWVDSVSISGSVCCTGPTAPTIQTQPQSQNVIGGSPANFSVAATGTGTLAYQWYFNSNGISGATATNYFIAAADATNAGNYFVVVSNNISATTSSLATLTVVLAPVITQSPSNQTVQTGLPANFTAAAIGAPTLVYQWRKNSNSLAGANGTNYPIAIVTAGDAGYYDIIVTNSYGSVTSSPALLTVVNPVAFSGVLVGWDMAGLSSYGPSPMSATTNAMNVTVTAGLTRGSGFTLSGTAAGGGWGGNGLNSVSAAAAITAGDFATFSLKANAGYAMSITNLSRFDYRRSGTTSATNGLLQYSLDGTAFTDITNLSFPSSSSSGVTLAPMDLSFVAALQNVPPGTNVTFRLVLYGASSSTANWYVFQRSTSVSPYELEFSGSLAPVVVATPPPVITVPPSPTNVFAGNNAGFSVTATGNGPLNYQWLKNGGALANGGAISGAQTNALNFVPAATNHTGSYSVIVTNLGGGVTSSVALLNVVPVPALSFTNSPGGLVLGANGGAVSNRFVVLLATNLVPPVVWVPLQTNLIGTNGQIRFTETNRAAPFRFYRLLFP